MNKMGAEIRALGHFSSALAEPDQPTSSYIALMELARQLVGAELFTLTMVDHQRREATRLYTSRPRDYPVLGTKPMPDNQWSQTVLRNGEIFVANNSDEIAKVFFDHALIKSLGCESIINIPVHVAGEVIGTINCLHEAGHYSASHQTRAEGLRLPGAAVFLLAKSIFNSGDQ